MSLADYYNAQADANMQQLWAGIGESAAQRADAQWAVNETVRKANAIIAEKNQEIYNRTYDYVMAKKHQLVQESWKEGLSESVKDLLKKEHPGDWEDQWEKLKDEAGKYAIPMMHQKCNEIDAKFPEFANEAYLNLPKLPE